MVKASKWLRNILTGKKDKEREKEKGRAQPSPEPKETRSPPVQVPTAKEKRWSFRRSAGKDSNSSDPVARAPILGMSEAHIDQKRHAIPGVAAVATVAAAEAVACVIRMTPAINCRTTSAIEEAAAIRIQAVFRSYLARKALRALRGLVKVQALVRGHLVRKQATATLRCMQALVTVQARACAQRIRMVEEAQTSSQTQLIHRRSPQDHRRRRSYDMDRSAEENVKIVEMDLGESRTNSKRRNSNYTTHAESHDHRFSAYHGSNYAPPRNANLQHLSPIPSGIPDMSPRTLRGHFEDFSFTTVESSPLFLSAVSVPDSTPVTCTASQQESTYIVSPDHPLYPKYMSNTESSRAKARSQSAPKQRLDTYERQPSRRRMSVEGRNIPRGVKMQRSSSHVGSTAMGFQYPWYMKFDRSGMSLKDSECGSTSTVLTNSNNSRSLVAHEVHGSK